MPPSIKDAIGWMYDYIQPSSKLLDMGCATGYFGKYIKDTKQATVYGLEISDDKVEAEKVLDGVYSFDLDLEVWPEEIYEHTYDYIFFGDILEHVKEPGEVLKKSVKLLNDNGKIFISTPNVAHISTRLELINGNFEYESMGILDNTHLKYFTLPYLKRLIQEAGYNIEKIDYSTNHYPREIQKRLLKKAGLIPTDRFWKMTETREARAFQYKLTLVKQSGVKRKNTYSYAKLPTKPEQYRDGIISHMRGDINNLRKHAEEQAKIIEHYVRENEKLTKRISQMQSTSPIAHLKKYLKKAK